MTGRVATPVDQRTIPHGMELVWPVFPSLVEISFSETFMTIDPVFTSIPSLENFSVANLVILASNLQEQAIVSPLL